MNTKWPGTRKWYASQITSINKDGTYDVYFLDSSEVLFQIKASSIKLPLSNGVSGVRGVKHRDHLIGRTFADDGRAFDTDDEDKEFRAGEFKVVNVIPAKNFYLCERVRFEKDERVEFVEFDIGYVIRQVRKYEEE